MSARVDGIANDLALELEMPGCYLRAYNGIANDYFKKKAPEKWVSIASDLDSEICLCKALVGANAYLANFCSIEETYREYREVGHSQPRLYALRYDEEPSDVRVFELFLFHPRRTRESRLQLRMLPFPGTMKLRIKSLPGKAPGPKVCILDALPAGITVEVEGLCYQQEYTFDDLEKEGVGQELTQAGAFLNEVLVKMGDGVLPEKAWLEAADEVPGICNKIPHSVARYFTQTPYANSEFACAEIRELWRHGLDAPVLMKFVFNDILDRIQGDRYLKFTPPHSEEAIRYYSLHIGIDDLEAQDHYIGWLPMPRPYRDERDEVRSELYDNGEDGP